jgi:hypothetical protein
MAKAKTRSKPSEVSPARLRFAKKLVQRRKERGYATAYGFFHKNGAKKHFNFSYLHYLFIERGLRLPSKEGLRIVLDSLGRQLTYAEERRELLGLYLRAVTDGDSLFDPVFESAPAEPPHAARSDSPEEAVLALSATKQIAAVPRMSTAQVEALMTSPPHFWVTQYLLQTGLRRTPEELASALGLDPRTVVAAADALVKAKLLERGKSGALSSPNFATDLFEPMRSLTPERYLWLSECLHERVKANKEKHYYNCFVMAIDDDEKMSVMTRMFRQIMSRLYLIRPRETVSSGRLVALEARVAPLITIE